MKNSVSYCFICDMSVEREIIFPRQIALNSDRWMLSTSLLELHSVLQTTVCCSHFHRHPFNMNEFSRCRLQENFNNGSKIQLSFDFSTFHSIWFEDFLV